MPAPAPTSALWERGLKRELIQETAYYMFAGRIFLGLAAWLLFNESAQLDLLTAWPVHLCFFAYFVANAVLCLHYRAADARLSLVIIDLATNLGMMALAAALTGGVLSPVVLIFLLKISGYLLVYSAETGIAAMGGTVAGFGIMMLGDQLDWWSLASLAPERQTEIVFRVCVLTAMLGSAPWLWRMVAAREQRVRDEAASARGEAARARAALDVKGALLVASKAINRPTQLDDILNELVEVVPRLLRVDYCGIFLWNEEHGTYKSKAIAGVDPQMLRQLTSIRLGPQDAPNFEWARQLGKSVLAPARGIARLGLPEAPTILVAPLLSGVHFYGVMQIGRRSAHQSFTQIDLDTADGVASQAAVALERARLVEESRRFVRAVESTDQGVVITDRHGRILSVNQALLDMFGYSRDEIHGRNAVALSSMPDEWVREVQSTILTQPFRGEATARRKDASTFPMALHASLIRAEDDRIQGAVAIIEDISAQKQLQEQMQRADRLVAAGEIASGVAHEVNNALVGILGQAELARTATDIGTLRSALANVELQGLRISGIVQELLGFARRQPPQREAVDLRTLVADTLALMTHDLGRNRIASQTHFAQDIPPVSVDAKQIQQVLVNLITNAMQAMQPAGGTLSVAVEPDNDSVSVAVQDTGTGISSEALLRVFDPFYSTKPQGTGLGLSVSYGIVQAHGGDLTVRSAPKAGSTFTLTLPATRAATGAEPRAVLLVDDDDAVAHTLREMLAREGMHVRRAGSGAEALSMLAHDPFDAIFLDVRLPDISGPQVYERLLAMRPEQARRVVFVTGGLWRLDSRGLREKLPPGQPTLSKPCTAAQIREVLRLLRDTRVAA